MSRSVAAFLAVLVLGLVSAASACTEGQREQVSEAIGSITVAPSENEQPSEEPTQEPTEEPTQEPTEEPTEEPTQTRTETETITVTETEESEAADEVVAEDSQPAAEDEGGALWPWLLGLAVALAVLGGLAAARSSGRRRRETWRRRVSGACDGALALAGDVTAALDATDLALERWAAFSQRTDQLTSELGALEPDSLDDTLRMEVGRLRSALTDLGPRLDTPAAPAADAEIRRLVATCIEAADTLRARLGLPTPTPPAAG